MRLRWWRRPEPVDPKHGRLPDGRLIDGDTVLAPGQQRWAGLLPGHEALTEPTRLIARPPTPAQRLRGEGGGWR